MVIARILANDPAADAVAWRGRTFSYGALVLCIGESSERFERAGIRAGSVVLLDGDLSPASIASLLALLGMRCIVVPIVARTGEEAAVRAVSAECEFRVSIDGNDVLDVGRLGYSGEHHPLYRRIQEDGHAGLVLFTSGSTGTRKAAVHDFMRFAIAFDRPGVPRRVAAFYGWDHVGGIDVQFRTLSRGGCLVCLEDRTPDAVLDAVESHRVQVLPASPTFLNLLALSGALDRHDVSSLSTIPYGAEPMPNALLGRLHEAIPGVRLIQTYGATEFGTRSTRGKDGDPSGIRIEDAEARIVDGLLEVRANTSMLGYLNAPSPFTPDGWMRTGDEADIDAEGYLRIRGRRCDQINVGGEKVNPLDVEDVILRMPDVVDAVVFGRGNAILGWVVCAKIGMRPGEALDAASGRIRSWCADRLPRHAVPIHVVVEEFDPAGRYLKKERPHDG